MNDEVVKFLCGAKPCSKGRAWLDSFPPEVTLAELYAAAPFGAWLVWACAQRPITKKRMQRLAAATGLFARAMLSTVPLKYRDACKPCVALVEAAGRGEDVDLDKAMTVTSEAWSSGRMWAVRVGRAATAMANNSAWLVSPDALEVEDANGGAFALDVAVDLSSEATVVCTRDGLEGLPTADMIREALGPLEDWL